MKKKSYLKMLVGALLIAMFGFQSNQLHAATIINPVPDGITQFTIEMDFEIAAGNSIAGVIFGRAGNLDYFMWQIRTDIGGGKSGIKAHRRLGGGPYIEVTDYPMEDYTITAGTIYTIKIDIDGSSVTGYIKLAGGGTFIEVLSYTHPTGANFAMGPVGVRHGGSGEDSYYDNIKVYSTDGGTETIFFGEDFEGSTKNSFSNGTITGGRLYVNGGNEIFQKSAREIMIQSAVDYDVEMDFKIVNLAGPLIGVGDHYLLWQISTGSFRPHRELSNIEQINFSPNLETGKVYHLKVEVRGDESTTYIYDGTTDLLGAYVYANPGGADFGLSLNRLGFRNDGGEAAYYDNIKITADVNGSPEIIVDEDFEGATNHFPDANRVEQDEHGSYWLYVHGRTINFKEEAGTPAERVEYVAPVTHFTVEMDFEIEKDLAAVFIGNGLMWQITTSQFRPHGGASGIYHINQDISFVNVPGIGANLATGTPYALKVEVSGNDITTYIKYNGSYVKIEERTGFTDITAFDIYRLGFRQQDGDAYFDNVKVTAHTAGGDKVLLFEDFSNPANYAFNGGSVVAGRLYASRADFSYKKKAEESGGGTGIQNQKSSSKVTVYPNPASDFINIAVDTKVQKVELINMNGSVVYAQENNSPISLASFAQGVYFVKIYTDESTDVVRFIKK